MNWVPENPMAFWDTVQVLERFSLSIIKRLMGMPFCHKFLRPTSNCNLPNITPLGAFLDSSHLFPEYSL